MRFPVKGGYKRAASPAERNTRREGMGRCTRRAMQRMWLCPRIANGRVAAESSIIACPPHDHDQTDAASAYVEGNEMSELTTTLQVMLTPEEHEELERLAVSRGLSTSTVAREAILRLVRAEAARIRPRIADWSKTGRSTPDTLVGRSGTFRWIDDARPGRTPNCGSCGRLSFPSRGTQWPVVVKDCDTQPIARWRRASIRCPDLGR